MPDETIATPSPAVESPAVESPAEESTESFGEMLAEFEHSHTHKAEGDAKQLEGTVVSLDAEFVYLDIGYKTEGILPRTAFAQNAEGLELGTKFPVSVKGRNVERYYELSLTRVAQATDWASLQEAFAAKMAVVGTVTGVVKGGLTVDVGVRAFMPASRSGVRETSEMEKLVGQQITCRITKLDTVEEDVVVDRRGVLEEEAFALQQTRLVRDARGRGGDGDGAELRGVRGVRRSRWRGRAAAYQRYGLEPGEGCGRCAECGAAD